MGLSVGYGLEIRDNLVNNINRTEMEKTRTIFMFVGNNRVEHYGSLARLLYTTLRCLITKHIVHYEKKMSILQKTLP